MRCILREERSKSILYVSFICDICRVSIWTTAGCHCLVSFTENNWAVNVTHYAKNCECRKMKANNVKSKRHLWSNSYAVGDWVQIGIIQGGTSMESFLCFVCGVSLQGVNISTFQIHVLRKSSHSTPHAKIKVFCDLSTYQELKKYCCQWLKWL